MNAKNSVNDPYYLNREGEMLEKLGFYEEALKCYNLATASDSLYPPTTDAAENKARLLGQMGEWEEAVKSSFNSVRITDCYLDAAKLFEMIDSGDLKQAKLADAEMLEADASNFSALYIMGYLLSCEEKHDEALQYFIKASKTDPNNAFVWDDMGLSYLEMKKWDEAVKCFEKCLEIDIFRPNTWNNKAIALAELGRKKEALKSYEKALNIDPEYSIARLNKDELLDEMGRKE